MDILEARIPKKFLEEWDKWGYVVRSPISFEDEAVVEVHLINENGSKTIIRCPIGKGLE